MIDECSSKPLQLGRVLGSNPTVHAWPFFSHKTGARVITCGTVLSNVFVVIYYPSVVCYVCVSEQKVRQKSMRDGGGLTNVLGRVTNS